MDKEQSLANIFRSLTAISEQRGHVTFDTSLKTTKDLPEVSVRIVLKA
jgi:hypothetical protein